MNLKQNIIFFDGYCGLCDRFVTQVFARDVKHVFYFAPLQGPTASSTLPAPATLDSVLYLKDGRVLMKSQAVLEILTDLGGIYLLFGILKFFPTKLMDLVYDFVARNRYGWFGQSLTCRIPSELEKKYFLD